MAAASPAAFIVCVDAGAAPVSVLHPLAPTAAAAASTDAARAILTRSLVLGLCALLASLGLSGWSRSKGTGWTAGVGAGLATGLELTMG